LTHPGASRSRGFKIGSDEIGVYSVHLKSNLITHGNKEAETAKNIQKREVAIAQLLAHVHDVIGSTMPNIKSIVIGGDFNTNHDQDMFAAERTLDSLADAGYGNGFEGLPLSERVTHPGTHGSPDATFDYVFAKGLTASRPTAAHSNVSDHWPVTRDFSLH
jgi:endonuclease/exonuclease/phosphatase (EEP) superfamily protein YafD